LFFKFDFFRFPNISSNQFLSSSLPSINEASTKPTSRPGSSPQVQQVTDFQSKSTRVFQPNLNSIDEKTEIEVKTKKVVPQPTKVDVKRDIQILTLNDDGNNNQQSTIENDDQVPF
jgi:hypothetical protein